MLIWKFEYFDRYMYFVAIAVFCFDECFVFLQTTRDTWCEKTPKQLSVQQAVALENFYTSMTTLNNIAPKTNTLSFNLKRSWEFLGIPRNSKQPY